MENNKEEEAKKLKLDAENDSQKSILKLLPLPILMHILLSLPLPAICACRCVCKTWRNIITKDRYFIKRLASKPNIDEFILVDIFALTYDLATSSIQRYPLCSGSDFGFQPPLASCNGLVVLLKHGIQQRYCVVNPITLKLTILPRISMKDDTIFFGFGYIASTREFKVVMADTYRIKVHTVGTDTWRIRPLRVDEPNIWISGPGVYVNGAIHCIDHSEYRGGLLCIHCFDLATERFVDVIRAPRTMHVDLRAMWLGVLKGQLCISNYISKYSSSIGVEDVLDIWVLKVYEVEDSWSKEFGIRLPSLLWFSDHRTQRIKVMNVMRMANEGEEVIIATLCVDDLLVVCNANGQVLASQSILGYPITYVPSFDVSY